MRILNDEEMKALRPDVPMCQQTVFDCSGCSAQCGIVATAQHQADLKAFIGLLESHEFYDDFGGESAKIYRDSLVESLKGIE
uniref:Uncharacterized protein n=1 Tax=viral metagenome TaxID=1070528 RepID=A0A6M3IEG5_9ZZZZ